MTHLTVLFLFVLFWGLLPLEARSNRNTSRQSQSRTRVERGARQTTRQPQRQRTYVVRERRTIVRQPRIYRSRGYYGGSRWGYGPTFGAGAYIGGWGGYDIPVRMREPEGKIKFDLKRVDKSEREQAKQADVFVDGSAKGILDNVGTIVVDPEVSHEVEVRMTDGRTFRQTVELRDREKVTISPSFTEPEEKP